MSSDERRPEQAADEQADEQADGQAADDSQGQAGSKDSQEPSEQEAIEAFDPNDYGEGGSPQITLDRYLSKRRPVVRLGWVQIISLVAMLGALILIMVYKESCGRQVSQLFGGVADPVDGRGQKARPATRQKLPGVPVRLAPAPPSAPSASQPAGKSTTPSPAKPPQPNKK